MAFSISEPHYGADQSGLVCGYAFAPGIAGQPIDSAAASAWLSGSRDSGFLWLHFSLPHVASQAWMQQHVDIPPEYYELLQGTPTTRLEVVGDDLLAVVNDVQFFGVDPSAVSRVFLFVSRSVMVSARTTHVRAIDRLRTSVKDGEEFRSTVDLLAHLLRDQADVLVDIVRDATRQVDLAEDRILDADTSTNRPRLGALRRVLVRLQRLLAPEPAALFRLLNHPPAWLDADDVGGLRGSAEELSAAVADSVALAERVRLLQEELMALLNERTSRTLFTLTVVTALGLPLAIIPGLFGMNVEHIPFRDSRLAFWAIAALVLVVPGVIIALWIRRDRV